MKILDCTLRDGGYYTNWIFDDSLVRSMVKSLDDNYVDIIELGYKSPVDGGPYRKCNDEYIKKIIDFPTKSKLSFMVDVKDFVKDNKINHYLIDSYILDKRYSLFDMCRIAAKSNEIHLIKEISKNIIGKGYEIIINLMGISLVSDLEINDFIKETEGSCSAIYFADSYGNLLPSKVEEICKTYINNTSNNCGIHCHDNLGLAFANSLKALESGFSYVDGTLCGMGRGVGNTKTEQLVLHRNKTITPSLLDTIKEFDVLRQKYQWGFNSVYMLTGMNNIHPLYAQEINQSNFNSKELLFTIENLKNHRSYNKDLIKNTKKQRAVTIIPARYESSRFPGKPLAKINNKEMILHVADKCVESVGIENVYVATENDRIMDVVKQAGYNAILTSNNCLTGTDRVAEASQQIDADIFVNVQGDEPMINPQDIINCIEEKKQNPSTVINCMSRLNQDEDCNDRKIPKVICDRNNFLLYASRAALPARKSGVADKHMKQVCIYAFNKKELEQFHSTKKMPLEDQEDIEIIRFLENGIKVKMLEVKNISYAVDYPEDIAIIEQKINNKCNN